MTAPDGIHLFERPFPSANMMLIAGTNPILLDTGFGSDIDATIQLLHDAGTPPESLSLLLNSHYHSDHIGGNYGLQTRYGLTIAASWLDAAVINRRDPEACDAVWLNQPVQPYHVDNTLSDGDSLDTGTLTLHVLETPGHTLGHLSFYIPERKALLAGDAVHADDVAWLGVFRQGVGAIDRAIHTLDRLAQMDIEWMCSGHGAPTDDPKAAIDRARRRYERWATQPEKVAWHACKRIFTYALMIENGMTQNRVETYLLASGWYQDYCQHVFLTEPEDFIAPLLDELKRAGAVAWQGDRLVASTPHNAPSPRWWGDTPIRPSAWGD